MNRQSPEDFGGSRATLYNTIMVDTSHHTLVKNYRKNTTKGLEAWLKQ
jgi:hypothetical protein